LKLQNYLVYDQWHLTVLVDFLIRSLFSFGVVQKVHGFVDLILLYRWLDKFRNS